MSETKLHQIYKPSLSLLNDLYQISMAYGYWKAGCHNHDAIFQLFFRRIPFNGGFAVAAGLESVIDYIQNFRWEKSDIDYLASVRGADGKPLLCRDFLAYLESTPLTVTIDAIEEGRVVFANEPLIRVSGPLLQCQILETPLLNLINFPTLIATKAARVCIAAQNDRVLEFGVRRAQGVDGALSASRAAFIGGVHGTSNLLAGSSFGIPVSGTHAHSWVMSFDSELESFEKFSTAMPGNAIFLVDTYNSLEGIKNAIKVGHSLAAHGHSLLGIRLDSGDLGYLSIKARKMLDDAGLKDAIIVGSNDLDEYQIHNLKSGGAKINVWGVGTKLVTGYDDPALGGVYKMVATRKDSSRDWDYKIKLSEQISKITTPGKQQVRRFASGNKFLADMIYDEMTPPSGREVTIIDPVDMTRRKKIQSDAVFEDLLVPVFVGGESVYGSKGVAAARKRCFDDLSRLDESIKRILKPHAYPAGLELSLHERKAEMILKLKGF